MLMCELTGRGKDPLYMELYWMLRKDMENGSIRPGERLPSKRELSARLGVSVTTVEAAYGQLLAEGYLTARPGSGHYASKVECPAPAMLAAEPELPERERTGEREPEEGWFMDLASGTPRAELFPFPVLSRILRRMLSERGERLLQATDHSGAMELRQAIAHSLEEMRGIRVSPRQIVVGAGAEYLYGLIVQLLGRDKIYALEDPGYYKTALIYRKNGVACEYVEVDEKGMSVDSLRQSRARAAHVSPSHQFPCGGTMPLPRRTELLGWAMERPDRYLIEDDYDSEFRFSGRPVPALQSIDAGGRVIYVNTFSKTVAPALRIGYMVLPPALVERFERELGFYACTVPATEQYMLCEFIESGQFQRHVNRMRTYCRGVRDELAKAVEKSQIGPQCEILAREAGLHFLLKLHTDLSDREIRERAAESGIRLLMVSDCRRGTGGRGWDRTAVVSYAGIDPARIPEAVERLAASLPGSLRDG